MTTIPTSGAADLAAFDKAVADELQCVSTAPYSSNEICKWFAENVRERLAALAAGQATAAQQGVAYAELPDSPHILKETPWGTTGAFTTKCWREYPSGSGLYTVAQMRAFADATNAIRVSHGQAPATAQADSVQEDAFKLLDEVAQCFTTDDALPDNLLPRIDAVIAARAAQEGKSHE